MICFVICLSRFEFTHDSITQIGAAVFRNACLCFTMELVGPVSVLVLLVLLIFVDSPTGLESLIAGVSNNKEQ